MYSDYTVSLEDSPEIVLGISDYNSECKSFGIERKKVLKIFKKIIQEELTPRQRDCLLLYYFQKKDLMEISSMLNLNASTVCRHIKKGKNRLCKVMSYICNNFNCINDYTD